MTTLRSDDGGGAPGANAADDASFHTPIKKKGKKRRGKRKGAGANKHGADLQTSPSDARLVVSCLICS